MSDDELVHAKYDLHLLQSRVLNRLLNDIESLTVGLSAMQGNHPKAHVLVDKVERVLESMRVEVGKIRYAQLQNQDTTQT
jgi:hypothetical protein